MMSETALAQPSMVGRSVAARGRSLGISQRRIDFYARTGLLNVRAVGSGRLRDWSKVSDRRLAACALVMSGAPLTNTSTKLMLVDELDRKGWVDIAMPYGTIRLTLPNV